MNPFALSGPVFLFVYFGAICVTAFVGIAIRSVRNTSRHGDSHDASSLSGVELGYLRAGAAGALTSAIAGMLRSGQLEADPRNKLNVTSLRPTPVTVQQSSYRGAPSVQHTLESELEAVIYDQVASGVSDLRVLAGRCAMQLDAIDKRLQKGHLLIPHSTYRGARIVLFAAVILLLVFGGLRVMQGLSNGRPVFFLVLEMGLAALLVFLKLDSRRTVAGSVVLREALSRYAALGDTAQSAPQQLSSEEAALGVGVFGGTALLALAPGLFGMSATTIPTLGLSTWNPNEGSRWSWVGSSSSSSGSSCSSSSSCSGGSSCGSSCGGGCGGCGG